MFNLFDELTMTTTQSPTFIFIDGSYYCFYRYYSLMNWWKISNPDEPLTEPILNEIFLEKFKKVFVNTIQQMPKKLKIDKNVKPIIIVGKDCKRENIWRNEHFSKYKGNRVQEQGFGGGPFFKMAYEEELFLKGGAKAVLKHPKLEADDCIAISTKYLTEKYPNCTIYIITSDHDYLQLNAENVHIYSLAYKKLTDSKTALGNASDDLFMKIIMGDTSDNIPSVFPKCGQKTALNCLKNKEFFLKKMNNNEEYYKQYELNQKLIDFNSIPSVLREEFMDSLKR